MMKRIAAKLITPLKVCALVGLATVAFNASAGTVYVGNPTRPNVTWMPGHCHGSCYSTGYFLEVLNPPVCCRDVVWVKGHYGKHGKYISAHWHYKHGTVVSSR